MSIMDDIHSVIQQKFMDAQALQEPGLAIQRDTANADNNLTAIKAGLLPKQTAADIAESAARARLTDVNANLAPGLAKASEAQSYGSANANNAQVPLYGAQAKATLGGTLPLDSFGMAGNPIIQNLYRRLGLGMTSGN